MKTRIDYNPIIKHEEFLKEDLKSMRSLINKYASDHTGIHGFHEGDLVTLDTASGQYSGQQFPDFAGSTCSFLTNITVALSELKKPAANDNDILEKIINESRKEDALKRLPKSIEQLIKAVKLFKEKVPNQPTQDLCERLLDKLRSFEKEITLQSKSNNAEESKSAESTPIHIQDQKKTINGDFQNQQKISLSANYSAALFSKVNDVDSEGNINNNKPKKSKEEHKQITPPKSPVNNKSQ